MEQAKTFRIFNFGCKLNQYEGQLLRENLASSGWQEKDAAYAFIVNSCVVTQRAERKVRRLIGDIRKSHKSVKILLCGCMANLYKDIEGVDALFRNGEKLKIIESLTGHPPSRKGISSFYKHSRAFIKVQDGCNNYCSYCIIPYLRGRSRSRPKKDILEEIRNLLGNGYREIVLSGICLGEYGKDKNDGYLLVNLLEDILKIKVKFRVRLSSIEPEDVSNELIGFMKDTPRIARHLHIPFQSGEDFILEKMNRPYTQKDYLELIDKVKDRIEDVGITTDIIVGFPLEEERHFQHTLNFLRRVKPLKTHIFTYSRRPFIASGRFKAKSYPWQVKERRRLLEKETHSLSLKEKQRFTGKILEAVMEGKGRALTTNYLRVSLPSEFSSPDLFPIKVVSVDETEIKAKVVSSQAFNTPSRL